MTPELTRLYLSSAAQESSWMVLADCARNSFTTLHSQHILDNHPLQWKDRLATDCTTREHASIIENAWEVDALNKARRS